MMRSLVAASIIAGAVLIAGPADAATNVQRSYRLTPGAVSGATVDQVCTKGYASKVRPSASKSAKLKTQVLARYGLPSSVKADVEMDHLVPLELGGAPADLNNLWPEPWPDAHAKDEVENDTHDAVCSGRISLAVGQACFEIAWKVCPTIIAKAPR